MFKKFNYNLNHSPVGAIWGFSLVAIVCCLFVNFINVEGIMDKSELIITILGYITVMNLIVTTYILFIGEIKQVNVTYVCPTARKYMSEQEINEYEKTEEEKDKKFIEDLERAYKEI